ncbi:hypothetical protein [Streptomyces sp. NPDC002690]
MPRNSKSHRRLVADGRTYFWWQRHGHRKDESGRSVDCRQVLTLSPQPSGSGGPLRVVFEAGPGRYVPGGYPLGSGDVGKAGGSSLNLHEPGAVRALLDVARAHGWQPEKPGPVVMNGWLLLDAAAAAQAAQTARAEQARQTGQNPRTPPDRPGRPRGEPLRTVLVTVAP